MEPNQITDDKVILSRGEYSKLLVNQVRNDIINDLLSVMTYPDLGVLMTVASGKPIKIPRYDPPVNSYTEEDCDV